MVSVKGNLGKIQGKVLLEARPSPRPAAGPLLVAHVMRISQITNDFELIATSDDISSPDPIGTFVLQPQGGCVCQPRVATARAALPWV